VLGTREFAGFAEGGGAAFRAVFVNDVAYGWQLESPVVVSDSPHFTLM
jgi:hypothetical protein